MSKDDTIYCFKANGLATLFDVDRAMSTRQRIISLARSGEWWDYKLPLAIAIAYALAWRLEISLQHLWLPLFLLLIFWYHCRYIRQRIQRSVGHRRRSTRR